MRTTWWAIGDVGARWRPRSGTPGNSAHEAYLREKSAYTAERRARHTRAITASALVAFPSGAVLALLLAVGAGVSLPVALVAGGLVALAWMLVGARRFYAAVPEIEAWRRAAAAERRTARILGQLVRSGYVVLHDRTVSGSTQVLHHLVVGPSGVHVLIDQAGRGELRYLRNGAWLGSLPLRGVLASTAALAGEVARQLTVEPPGPAVKPIVVEPIVVAVDAVVLWRNAVVDGVTVLGLRDVVPHVLHAKSRLAAAQVAHTAEEANRLFPAANGTQVGVTVTIGGAECAELIRLLRDIGDRGGDAGSVLPALDRLADYLDSRRNLPAHYRRGRGVDAAATPPEGTDEPGADGRGGREGQDVASEASWAASATDEP